MSITEEKPKIIFENFMGIIQSAIQQKDVTEALKVIEEIASKFGYNLFIHKADLSLLYIKDIEYRLGKEIIAVNKYGLKLVIQVYPDREYKYIDHVEIYANPQW